MKAVLLHEYGGPSKLKYEDVPDPVAGPGEVLVRVAATSINPIDWKLRSGAAKEYMPLDLPAILGRDLSGVVRAIGEGVTGFAPGDRVMAMAPYADAELVAIKASDLALVPEKLDLKKHIVVVKKCRGLTKRDMIHNDALPKIEVDSETYEVRADAVLLTCEPAAVLPMAQRYFLF